ncbi:MAG: hypothetical protein M0Q92_04355 [Methanoregula sp.]|jgi:hypothetical protein|nr:hypothetical protein [Methanoregula sp.]
MNCRSIILICSLLVTGLLCGAGCTSSEAPAVEPITVSQVPTVASPETSVPPATSSPVPVTSPTGVATPAVTVPADTPVPATTTLIARSYGTAALDHPRIVLQTFVKEGTSFNIPNCAMKEVFPQAAGDPAYGIRQKPPKLVLLTDDEINAFIDTYADKSRLYPKNEKYVDPNSIGSPACAGVPANPEWNFIRINATFIPRNVHPGEYDIGFNLNKGDVVITQVRINQTFIIDETVILVRYIPLKVEEMDAFDNVELVFARRD